MIVFDMFFFLNLTCASCASEHGPQHQTQSRSLKQEPSIDFLSRILPLTTVRQYKLNTGTNCDRAYVKQLSPSASAFLPNWMHGQKNERKPAHEDQQFAIITITYSAKFIRGMLQWIAADSSTIHISPCRAIFRALLTAVRNKCSRDARSTRLP